MWCSLSHSQRIPGPRELVAPLGRPSPAGRGAEVPFTSSRTDSSKRAEPGPGPRGEHRHPNGGRRVADLYVRLPERRPERKADVSSSTTRLARAADAPPVGRSRPTVTTAVSRRPPDRRSTAARSRAVRAHRRRVHQGDAYDLFLDPQPDRPWNYREGGAPEPSMTTTFEGYTPVGSLTIATDHKTADGKSDCSSVTSEWFRRPGEAIGRPTPSVQSPSTLINPLQSSVIDGGICMHATDVLRNETLEGKISSPSLRCR